MNISHGFDTNTSFCIDLDSYFVNPDVKSLPNLPEAEWESEVEAASFR